MRLQLTESGRIRATLQSRVDGSQSRIYCCEGGHDGLQEAAEHGAAAEVADELAYWLSIEQPEVVTEQRAVLLDEATGKYVEGTRKVEPHVLNGQRGVHVFDRRLIGERKYRHLREVGDGVVALLGVRYRIVYGDAGRVVGVRVGD